MFFIAPAIPRANVDTNITDKFKETLPPNTLNQNNLTLPTINPKDNLSVNNLAIKNLPPLGIYLYLNGHEFNNSFNGEFSLDSVVNKLSKKIINILEKDPNPGVPSISRIFLVNTDHSNKYTNMYNGDSTGSFANNFNTYVLDTETLLKNSSNQSNQKDQNLIYKNWLKSIYANHYFQCIDHTDKYDSLIYKGSTQKFTKILTRFSGNWQPVSILGQHLYPYDQRFEYGFRPIFILIDIPGNFYSSFNSSANFLDLLKVFIATITKSVDKNINEPTPLIIETSILDLALSSRRSLKRWANPFVYSQIPLQKHINNNNLAENTNIPTRTIKLFTQAYCFTDNKSPSFHRRIDFDNFIPSPIFKTQDYKGCGFYDNNFFYLYKAGQLKRNIVVASNFKKLFGITWFTYLPPKCWYVNEGSNNSISVLFSLSGIDMTPLPYLLGPNTISFPGIFAKAKNSFNLK